jgi:DNA polymerase II large subunit
MGFLDRFKKKPVEAPKAEAKPKKKSAKDTATEKGEPYVAILSVDLDPDNIGNGAFELDWNDKFIANLVRAGYQHKSTDTDADLVDRWFADVCKNVVAENFEQWEANQPMDARPRNIERRDIGDGRTEVS